jgi:[histone H3]-lysine4 N-trimethyltransferase SETD1
VGFNPLINFARVSHVFSSFGDVAESSNKMHPETGSYLGFATFRYRDTHIARSKNYGLKATDAARRAVREMHGHKLEAHVIRVEFDPEGKKSRRMLEEILRKEREAAEAEAIAATAHLSTNKSVPTGPRGVATGLVVGPPPLAPKGPAAHRQATFAAPDAVTKPPMQPRQYATVEEQLVAPLIAELPYIFVSREFVPVMPTTIPHMKRRLKSYRLEDIRLDRTGYYILFDNSPNGCLEAQRCHRSASGTELFNYKFIMQLHLPVGSDTNINTKDSADVPSARTRRSPSPERRRHVEVKVREDRDRRRREEENDLEEEKRQRAKNFDPVLAACEVVRKELIEHLIKHIRTRVAAPALTAHLHPTNQIQNRRKAGLEDFVDVFAPNLGGQSPRVGTPNSSTDPIERRTGRLEVAALPRIRKVKGSRKALQQNYTFADPFSRKRPAPKSAFRSLHYRLQSPDSDADSDDEADVRASVARETEEPESRPRSRMSTDDEFSRDDLASWGPGEDDSMTEASFAASGLPSKKRKSEPEGLSVAKRQKKSAEELFGIDSDHVEMEPPLRELEATPEVDLAGDIERSISRSETPTLSAGKALLKQKSKKKSKKQIFEEREAAKKQHEADKPRVEEILPDELIQEDVKEEEVPPSPKPATATIDVELFSYDVESSLAMPDDFSFGLEALRGLNMTETDLPDLARLRKKFGVADLGNVKQWLWNWTQIRELNSADPDNGRTGGIDGYYVPNSTGCARTEGVKKILNSEKSKYLPHHIKVLKAREAREAKVKKDGKDSVIPTPLAPAKGNSRANRASNRRHATLLQDELKMSTDPDVFKFNQLKKRKKPVKFARSAIHNWGLYTEENINKDDMIIEYVGEQVRQQISEIREKKYLKQGMGSSYLFRIDENTVIDATKKGGIARFINHSCMPNCTAKIIKVDGSKRIVIYALRDIARSKSRPLIRLEDGKY